jgi:replicative DNA helicase
MKDADTSQFKLPPQNLDAEQSILGGILLDNQALNNVLEILTANDFYSDIHRKIFTAVLELSEKNEPCDVVTLSNHLIDKKQLDQIGGRFYMSSLV